jgi:hypothetical protein
MMAGVTGSWYRLLRMAIRAAKAMGPTSTRTTVWSDTGGWVVPSKRHLGGPAKTVAVYNRIV